MFSSMDNDTFTTTIHCGQNTVNFTSKLFCEDSLPILVQSNFEVRFACNLANSIASAVITAQAWKHAGLRARTDTAVMEDNAFRDAIYVQHDVFDGNCTRLTRLEIALRFETKDKSIDYLGITGTAMKQLYRGWRKKAPLVFSQECVRAINGGLQYKSRIALALSEVASRARSRELRETFSEFEDKAGMKDWIESRLWLLLNTTACDRSSIDFSLTEPQCLLFREAMIDQELQQRDSLGDSFGQNLNPFQHPLAAFYGTVNDILTPPCHVWFSIPGEFNANVESTQHGDGFDIVDSVSISCHSII